MAILNNCFCVFSIWTGSYMSGIYSIVYYSLHIVLEALLMVSSPQSTPGIYSPSHQQRSQTEVATKMDTVQPEDTYAKYFTPGIMADQFVTELPSMLPSSYHRINGSPIFPDFGDDDKAVGRHHSYPHNGSFIDYDSGTARFMITVLFPAGILASALLMAGLCWNKRYLMLPWLLVHPIITLIDLIEVVRILLVGKIRFSPISVITFSGSLFLTSINTYSLLCVLSQYQDFKAGRLAENPPAASRSSTQPLFKASQRSTITSPSVAHTHGVSQQATELVDVRTVPHPGPGSAGRRANADLEVGGCSRQGTSRDSTSAANLPLTKEFGPKSYESMNETACNVLMSKVLDEATEDKPMRKQVSFVQCDE